MMALIDTIMLFNKAYDMARPVEYYLDCNERVIALSDLAKLLDNVPTIEERKPGHWILVTDKNGQHFICDHCGEWKYRQNQKFCGECGADMREGEQE